MGPADDIKLRSAAEEQSEKGLMTNMIRVRLSCDLWHRHSSVQDDLNIITISLITVKNK